MRRLLMVATLASTFSIGGACPTTAKCPIHNVNGVYDHDEWPSGKHVKYFKCSWGHLFGVVC